MEGELQETYLQQQLNEAYEPFGMVCKVGVLQRFFIISHKPS